MVSMNRLSIEQRVRVVSALVEGCSIRATVRMTGVAKNTVIKLLVDLGAACGDFQDEQLLGLRCERIQADETWSFCYAKDKNLPDHMRGKPGVGSIWTWVAMCADTKLAVAWMSGDRDACCAKVFMHDVADRLANRVQLTTDGLHAYLSAVSSAFGNQIDYAMLVKVYGTDAKANNEARYSPPECIGCKRTGIIGRPLRKHVSTSFVERQNLTMRMQMRRYTRLTNAFSKKAENLRAALNLHFMHYNFCRLHQSIKTTPAVAAGVADQPWSIEALVGLLQDRERSQQ